MKKYHYIPVVVFIALSLVFARQLILKKDPSLLPSVLINENFPNVEFENLQGYNLLKFVDIISYDKPALVNVWSSWCAPCRVEHGNLMILTKKYGFRIYGINYKDDSAQAIKVLKDDGNPFYSIGVDNSGRAAIDLGVYGVPETFILDSKGIIKYRHVGPILEYDITEIILPLLNNLEKNE